MLREEEAAPNAEIITAEETNDPGLNWSSSELGCVSFFICAPS